ncbi:uncharacterized protein (DUF885 family) [Umezawaea tangerina]|uniref:Uncharacterized protein (DUF885 family) n=1 Tax=Umezawaea tangerina TaxID=84725 RepID=A0A2T0SRZ4_9PSEU|nr:uncharacterized protein (DUF885 family) [Umezawaea tangerina]
MADLADTMMDLLLDAEPLSSTLLGLPGRDHLLRDLGVEAESALRARAEDVLGRAVGGDPTTAVVADQATALLEWLDALPAELTCADVWRASAAGLLTMLPLVRPVDERGQLDYLARLSVVPRFLEQLADRQRAAAAAGVVPVARLARRAVDFLDRYLADPDGDPLRTPELDGPRDAKRLRLLEQEVRPAFAAYRAFLHDEIAPQGRGDDRPGLCALPGGAAMYAGLVRRFTTTSASPEELHRTGLELVAELEREYLEVGSRVFGLTTVEAVRERVRTDPALRWADADGMLAAAEATVDRALAVAPRWFGRLPRGECAVERVPEAAESTAPLGYYVDPALDGSRPGTYFVNTRRPGEQDRTIGEALAFHEGVPGHHLQIALAQELGDLPLIRRIAVVEAYTEGWGLYAERLADEMGLYTDDVARLGMLAQDSARAARLVVDTGMHAFGWSVDRAVEYLRASTAMAEADIRSQVDRFVENPGQALAYMVGRLEFQRLRREAEQRLGAAFDLKAFHDLVLGGGPLPMAVLADVVDRWSARLLQRGVPAAVGEVHDEADGEPDGEPQPRGGVEERDQPQ